MSQGGKKSPASRWSAVIGAYVQPQSPVSGSVEQGAPTLISQLIWVTFSPAVGAAGKMPPQARQLLDSALQASRQHGATT